MATSEDNVEVVSDFPLEEETDTEKETPETEEDGTLETQDFESEREAFEKERKTLQAQKEHWRKKAQDLEKKSPKADGNEDEFRPRVEFLLENRDVNQEEYDHLAAVAMRSYGKISLESLRDAKKSEAGYVSYLRKKSESKSKTPGSTSPSGFSRVLKSAEEIGNMNPAQHRAYEESVMRAQNQGI